MDGDVDMDDNGDMSNNNAPRQRRRRMTKCSACREKKCRCEPEDRDWEGNRQKCNYCTKHELACSANYIKNDDPAVQSRNGLLSPAGGRHDQQYARPSASAPTITSTTPALPIVTQSLDFSLYEVHHESIFETRELSDEELEEKALSKQHRFNELIIILECCILHLDSSRINGYQNEDAYRELKGFYEQVREVLHYLFIDLVELGCLADSRSQTSHTECIYLRLLLAWEKHPQLYDSRKRHTLLKMARFFQENKLGYDPGRIFAILVEIGTAPTVPPDQNPCHMLAQSLMQTSDGVSHALVKTWERRHGLGDIPSNLALPPLQRAALHPNADVVAAVFSNPQNDLHAPDIVNQRPLHIAAERGLTSELTICIQTGTAVDVRDCYNRTALFLAAGKGKEDACRALIEAGADIKNRDICGRTILGVAAKGGHLPTVECLVSLGAEVNPLQFRCRSTASTAPTPLHAAIESGNEPLSRFLFHRGASVSDRREPDMKTAIDLARERGWDSLEREMCEALRFQENFPWGSPNDAYPVLT